MWKDVKGFEGLYQVSGSGEVKSLPRNGTKKGGKKICQHIHKTGYMYCTLCKHGKLYNKQVHRLVAEAFIPNLDDKPVVNHKDGDKVNNSLDNLEWVTLSENALHSIRVLGNKPTRHGMKPIRCVETGQVWDSRRRAERELGIAEGGILHALKGKVPRCNGLHWEYI